VLPPTCSTENAGAKFRKKEWQRIGDQIDAAFVFARADFVNVHFLRDKLEDLRLKSLRNKL
jgi:hypothetical protein